MLSVTIVAYKLKLNYRRCAHNNEITINQQSDRAFRFLHLLMRNTQLLTDHPTSLPFWDAFSVSLQRAMKPNFQMKNPNLRISIVFTSQNCYLFNERDVNRCARGHTHPMQSEMMGFCVSKIHWSIHENKKRFPLYRNVVATEQIMRLRCDASQ